MRTRLLSVLVVLSFTAAATMAVPARADLKKGVTAYHTGDFVTAHAEFSKLADAGDPHGQFNLGVLYLTGSGVDPDPVVAAAWHQKAAEQGLATAQHGLGVLYYKGLGVKKSYREALTWFRRAAAQKYAHSEFNIAVMYFNEQGLVRNDLEIIKWLSLAAARDFPAAQFRLGQMYEKAVIFSQDHRTALYWYRLAVANGAKQAAADGVARMEKSLRLRPSGVTPAVALTQAAKPDELSVKETPKTPLPSTAAAPPPAVVPVAPLEQPQDPQIASVAAASLAASVSASATAEAPAKPPATAEAAAPATPRTKPGKYEWRTQFSAFRTETEAEKAWNTLTRNAKGVLNGLAPIIERADLGPRGIYHRLQTGPMDSARAANSLCTRVIQARPKQACMTVRRPLGGP